MMTSPSFGDSRSNDVSVGGGRRGGVARLGTPRTSRVRALARRLRELRPRVQAGWGSQLASECDGKGARRLVLGAGLPVRPDRRVYLRLVQGRRLLVRQLRGGRRRLGLGLGGRHGRIVRRSGRVRPGLDRDIRGGRADRARSRRRGHGSLGHFGGCVSGRGGSVRRIGRRLRGRRDLGARGRRRGQSGGSRLIGRSGGRGIARPRAIGDGRLGRLGIGSIGGRDRRRAGGGRSRGRGSLKGCIRRPLGLALCRVRRRSRASGWLAGHRRARRRRSGGGRLVERSRRNGDRVAGRRGGRSERRRRSGPRRQERQRVDVALSIRGHPNAEIHVRLCELDVAAGPDRPDGVSLRQGRAALDADRAEMEQRDGVAVLCLDRHGLATIRDRAREADRARGRRTYRRARLACDVDAPMLARGIGVAGAERECVQDRTVRRPGPGRGRGNEEERREDADDEDAHDDRLCCQS